MIDLYEARVFSDENGAHGDKHGIIIDEERKINSVKRQSIAINLDYAETIFINDIDKADISFFAQTEEIPFAGTPALAVARMLEHLGGKQPASLVSMCNTIPLTFRGNAIWTYANLSIMPAWHHIQLKSALDVKEFDPVEAKKLEHTMIWAWDNEKNGIIRARTFASDWLLPEVEANGSGSMLLALQLGRRIVVIHGNGSKIFAEPKQSNIAGLGGRVTAVGAPIRQLDF